MSRLQRALAALAGRIDTPAPIVLVDVMQENIDRMQAFADQHGLDGGEQRQPAADGPATDVSAHRPRLPGRGLPGRG